MVDKTFAGNAAISTARPDVPPAFPDASANCGYAFKLNTNRYAPGKHTLAIVVKSADGYTTTLRTITVNVVR